MSIVLSQSNGDPILFIRKDWWGLSRLVSHDGGKSWQGGDQVEIMDAPFSGATMGLPGRRILTAAASGGRHIMLAFESGQYWIPGGILESTNGGQSFEHLLSLPPHTAAWPLYSEEAGWWAIAARQKIAAIAQIKPPAPTQMLTRHGRPWPGWEIVDVYPDKAGVYLLVETDGQYGALELPWGNADCHDWQWFPPRMWPRAAGAVCMADQVPIFMLPYANGQMEIFIGDAPTQGIVVPAPGEPVSMEWFPKYRRFVALFRRPSGKYVAAWAPAGSFNFEISWEEEE